MKFTVSTNKSNLYFVFKYIKILFDKYASIDIDTIAVDSMRYF